MQANWTTTAAALPTEGAIVEFLLDDRECPMQGVYALGRFESRWNFYAPTRVCQWRDVATKVREHEVPCATAIRQKNQCFAGTVMAAAAASLLGSLGNTRAAA